MAGDAVQCLTDMQDALGSILAPPPQKKNGKKKEKSSTRNLFDMAQ